MQLLRDRLDRHPLRQVQPPDLRPVLHRDHPPHPASRERRGQHSPVRRGSVFTRRRQLVTARDLWPGQADAGDATLVLPATAGMDVPWTRASMTRIAEDWLMGGLVDRRLFLSASGAVLAQALTAFL